MGDHGVAAAEGVLGGAEWVVPGRGLREPHVAAVAAEVALLEGVGDVLLDDDGAAGGVDEPGACSRLSIWTSYWVEGEGSRDLPGFILAMSSLLKRPLVDSCSGQLIVTTSHCATISSRFATLRHPISFSFSADRGW